MDNIQINIEEPAQQYPPDSSGFHNVSNELPNNNFLTEIGKDNYCHEVALRGSEGVGVPPKLIFIVPYRDRQQHFEFFNKHMKNTVLLNKTDYKIYYIEQCDTRDFNRGAMKNIGFLAMKEKYPNDYKNITFVFNDIDTMPFTSDFLNYYTTQNVIKHFYGYSFTLGGIVSILGSDFEKIMGFPNLWTWGYEDNSLQKRAQANNIIIDRSQFYPVLDINILQLKDGVERIMNRKEFDRYITNNADGINDIRNLTYNIDENTGIIKVTWFLTGTDNNPSTNIVYDLRNGSIPFPMKPRAKRGSAKMGMFI